MSLRSDSRPSHAMTTPADDLTTIRVRIAELSGEVHRLNDAYYGSGDSPLPDADYDAMKDELAALVAEHPELEPADSPLGKVNAPSELTGPTVRHARPMLSLAKASTEERGARLLRPLPRPDLPRLREARRALAQRRLPGRRASTTSPREAPARSASS